MGNYLRAGRVAAAASTVLIIGSTVAAEKNAGPWTNTVPLPTACYSSQDEFRARTTAAVESINSEIETRKAGNQQISAQQTDINSANPMELAQRMQQNMMNDPEAAKRFMEQMGATDPNAAQEEQMQAGNRAAEMQAAEKAFVERYKAARRQAAEPAHARYMALRKRLGITEGWGVGESAPDSVYAEYDALKREADQAYAAFCPAWWGATGEVQAFMKRYKAYLVNERVPLEEKRDSQTLANYQMTNIDASGYKSVAAHQAVVDYVNLSQRLYDERDSEPLCSGTQCRDVPGI